MSKTLYDDGIVSIVVDPPRKVDGKTAGFIRNPHNLGETEILDDRICCHTCPNYLPSDKKCEHVCIKDIDIEDTIDPRDCCNDYHHHGIRLKPEEQETNFLTGSSGDKTVVKGFASSQDMHAILNGLPRIVVNTEALVRSYREKQTKGRLQYL
jgi:hypothetical protein